MAVYRAIPTRFARIHSKSLTPTWATIGMGIVSAGFFLLMTWISENILLALIGAIGLQIAFYYGLTGLACVWFYRKTLTDSVRHFFMRGVIPLAGGLFLFVMFIYATRVYSQEDNLVDADGNNVTIFGIGAGRGGRHRLPVVRPRPTRRAMGRIPVLFPREDPPETQPRRPSALPRGAARCRADRAARLAGGHRHRTGPVEPARRAAGHRPGNRRDLRKTPGLTGLVGDSRPGRTRMKRVQNPPSQHGQAR